MLTKSRSFWSQTGSFIQNHFALLWLNWVTALHLISAQDPSVAMSFLSWTLNGAYWAWQIPMQVKITVGKRKYVCGLMCKIQWVKLCRWSLIKVPTSYEGPEKEALPVMSLHLHLTLWLHPPAHQEKKKCFCIITVQMKCHLMFSSVWLFSLHAFFFCFVAAFYSPMDEFLSFPATSSCVENQCSCNRLLLIQCQEKDLADVDSLRFQV